MTEPRDALAQFAREVIRLAWSADVDGADVQDLAEKHGLVVRAPGDPAKHGEITEAQFDPGEEILVFADWLELEAGGWQPIDTAPKDGTPVRVLVEAEVVWRSAEPAILVAGGWQRVGVGDKITGWLPSPPLPEEK